MKSDIKERIDPPINARPFNGDVLNSPMLPDFTPPKKNDAARLSAGQIKPEREFDFLSADNAIIPEAFGDNTIPPRFATVIPSGANIILRCVWCRGEQGSMTLFAGNEPFTGTVTHYLGTPTQTVDPTLAAAIAGYTDTLDGICYSVVTLPGNKLDLANSLLIRVNGRLIPDPRAVPTNLSSNPALCYLFVATAVGLTVDMDSIIAAADVDDQIIPTLTQKRWTWGMVFDQPEEIESQLRLIAEYAGCFHVRDGGTVKLVPDRPASTSFRFSDLQADIDAIDLDGWTIDTGAFTIDSGRFTIDGSQVAIGMIVANSLQMTKKRLTALPNQSIVQYTNTSKFPWRKPFAKSPTPVGDIRPTTFNMHGFRDFNTAFRFAAERQNKFDLSDLVIAIESFDEGLSVETGDVVEVTHNVGLVSRKLRTVNTGAASEPGHWIIRGESFDPAVYSDATDAEPIFDDITLPNPSDVPDGPDTGATTGNLTVTDKNYTDEMGFTYSVLSVSFTGVSWPWASSYRIKVFSGSFVVLETTIAATGEATHTVVTSAVTQGTLYTIEVWVLNNFGGTSAIAGTTTKRADGKALGPSNVPDTVTVVENGFFMTLDWEPATDSDLQGYLVRALNKTDYDAVGTDDARWNHVNVQKISERNDLTNIQISGQAADDYYYGVKAIDEVHPKAGHESVLARWALGTVTENAGVLTRFYIKPINGTAIRNGTGTLTIEGHFVTGGVDTLMSTGTVKLFVGATEVTEANGFATGSDGFTGVFDTGDITGSVTVELKDGPTGDILDTISLVDIDDGGNAIYGFVETSAALSHTRASDQTTWTPTGPDIDLTATFVQAGAVVARESWRLTRSAAGLLTGATVTLGNELNIARIGVVEIAEGTQAMSVEFTYTDPVTAETVVIVESVITSMAGTDGDDGVSATLTNSTPTIAVDVEGFNYVMTTGTTFDNSTGTFEVIKGSVDLTGTVTNMYDQGFGWTAATGGFDYKEQNGMRFYIHRTNGTYDARALVGINDYRIWTTNTETFTVKAVVDGVTFTRTYTITKTKGASSGSVNAIFKPPLVSDTDTTGTVWAEVKYDSDGAIYTGKDTGAGFAWSNSGFDWLLAGANSEYEILFSLALGDTPNEFSTGVTLDTWHALSADRSLGFSTTGGPAVSCTIQTSIRRISTSVILDTREWLLFAFVDLT